MKESDNLAFSIASLPFFVDGIIDVLKSKNPNFAEKCANLMLYVKFVNI
jgi:hypothetical protein